MGRMLMIGQSLDERVVAACIEMSAGEVICFEDDVFAELKRRRLIRKVRDEDSLDDADYVINAIGTRLAERYLARHKPTV